jgi:anti-anti-sigma factor
MSLPFESQYSPETQTMQITLKTEPGIEGWAELTNFFQEKIRGGIVHWFLDLRKLESISSISLGMIVGFNTNLISRQGRLRLLLQQKSRIANLIHLSKLDRIVDVAVL